MKNFASILLATSVAAGAAQAGGVAAPVAEPQPMVMPAAVPQTDWTGFYAGASLGYADADAEFGVNPLAIEADGPIGGLFAGYQQDFGRFVLGGEFDANIANADADIEALTGIDDIDVALDQLHRLKLRAGYDAGNALVYGVVGAAYANVNEDSDAFGEFDYDDWGYVVGLGTDVRVSDNVTVGAEVLYHQFDDLSDDSGEGFEADLLTVQARVAYNF